MVRIGDRKQFWSGLLFLVIGAGALWKLPAHVGTAAAMGPGYFPMLLGVCLTLLGGASIVLAVRATEPISVGPLPVVPLFFIIGSVLAFAALVDRSGLAVSLLCLVLASCYQRLRKRPLEVLAIYLGLLGLTWLIFLYAVQLPISFLF